MQAMETGRADGQTPTVIVWIENEAGAIARGRAESVSEQGAEVQLSERPELGEGDEVSVRISFNRASPIIAAAGRISEIRGEGEAASCRLEWTETEQLARWIQACA